MEARGKFEFASQERIEAYEDVAHRFFRDVLDMSMHDCVSDESWLSDFSSCGLPEEIADVTDTMEEIHARWDIWILDLLRARYGLEYQSTAMPLLVLFRDLDGFWRRHEH